MMLTVMRHIKNFFNISSESGDFSLADGVIALQDAYKPGQYILLTGSMLVDGVYRVTAADNGAYTLENTDVNEEWAGTVYGLRIPPDFARLCADITAFTENNKPTAFTSESVSGVHSWSKAVDKTGLPVGWEALFAKRLNAFRKMFTEVSV